MCAGPSILAKLTAPRLDNVYLRTRLFKRLNDARKKPVIWISAPAGSGKTTLVASYLQDKKIIPLWYQVDEGDADLASFFYYLGLLDKQVNPRRKKHLPLLTPEYLAGLPIFTRNFFRELYSRIKSPGVLVFDNFQEAGTDIQLHQFLPQSLAEIPQGINVIIISRSDPPASVSRLQVSDQMTVLDWEDLRLSDEESVAIGRLHAQSKSITEKTYRSINALVKGWVTGLVLHIKYAGGDPLPESMGQRDHKAIFEYFAGEILDRLGERYKTVLQQTAFLPKISATAARDLSHDDNADQILTECADHNSFTIRHTGPIETFEFHPLFREFLQSRAKRTLTPEQLNTLLRQSAQQLKAEGRIEDTMELLQQAQDWDSAGQLILQYAQALVEQGRGQTIAQWINSIPKDVVNDQPWLNYWLGVAQLPYSPPEARQSLEDAYTSFKVTEDTVGQLLAWSSIIDTFVFEYGDCHPLDHWIAEMDAWLQAHTEFPSPELQVRVACGMFSALMFRQPYRDDLRQVWEPQVSEMVLHGDNPLVRVQYGSLLFLYYSHWAGDCNKGKVVLDNLSSLKNQSNLPPLVEVIWYFYTGIQYFITGQIETAREALKNGLHVADETGIRIYESFLCSILFYASLLVNDKEGAEIYQGRMRSALNQYRFLDVSQYHLALCYKSIIGNDLMEAREQIRQAIEVADKSGQVFFIFYTKVGGALVTIHEGKHQEALALLEEILAGSQRHHFVSLEQASYFFKAELFMKNGEFEKCLPSLRRALAITRQSALNNPIWWRDSALNRLLAIALAHDIESDYVRFLIRQRQLVQPDDLSVPETWPFPIRVYTLGRFSLLIDDAPVVFTGKAQKKPLELLKALIALGGRGVSVEQLTDALWPDAEGDSAYQSFTMALQRLRRLLKHKDALLLSEGKLTLDTHYVWVDAWAFERGLGEAQSDARDKALALHKGDFLANDLNAPWALSVREHLRQRFLRALTEHSEHLEQHDQIDQAIIAYERGLEVDPLAEAFYQGLMRCNQRLGQRCAAVQAYERCKEVMNAQLGVEPSDDTLAIYRDIQQSI